MVNNEPPISGLKQLMQKIENDKKAKEAKKTPKTKPNFTNNSYQPLTSSFKGLNNFGNACYSNVIIQCLTSIKEFNQLLSTIYSKIENDPDLISKYPYLSSIVEIVNLYQMKNPSLASDIIKQLVSRFDSSGEQNDAHEFLIYLLDKLNQEIMIIESKYNITTVSNSNQPITDTDKDEGQWEEIKKGNKRMKQTNSIQSFQISSLAKVFQGILKHDIESKGKSLSQCQIEPFYTLSLDIGTTSLQGAFDSTFSKKKIEKSTNKDSDKFIQTYIEQISQILIVQLKAFYFDKNTMQVIKVKEPISYDVYITLKKEYFPPFLRNQYTNVKYELICVIIHKGTKASEGHYICYCKDDNGSWYYLNDKKVIKVSEESLKSTRPYLLFFRKL